MLGINLLQTSITFKMLVIILLFSLFQFIIVDLLIIKEFDTNANYLFYLIIE